MGVDISGLNPTIKSPRPELIYNSDGMTEEQKEEYWDTLDKWQEENPGFYFRSSWWGWRPIHELCEAISRKAGLRINTTGWGENSGYGLKNPKKCQELADALEEHITNHLKDELKENTDRIYVCMGSWSTDDGKFLHDDVEEKLNEQYPFGTIFFNGVVLEDGTVAYPSHGSSLKHIKNWINFLRECGGFQIY